MDTRKKAPTSFGRGRKSTSSSSRITMGYEDNYQVPAGLKPVSDRSTSASKQADANTIQTLKEENETLKQELEQLRSLYNQLVSDTKYEKYDERRVQLLKAQLVQLERQVILQSDALSSRSKILMDVENAISALTDQLRELLASETRGPSVSIQRAQLTSLIESLQSARFKLYRNIEGHNNDNFTRPLLFMNPFVKENCKESVTLLDVCSGTTDHISLKQVAKLESKLFKLHKELYHLQQSLEHSPSLPSSIEPSVDHLNLQMQHCNQLLSDSCQDLVALSVLIPAAPWGVLQKPVLGEFSVDKVMKSLPSFVKSQQQQGKAVIEALLKTVNYSIEVNNHKVKALQEELGYHKGVYDVQIQYIQSLFDSVRGAYKGFEASAMELVCKPLQEVLEAFGNLKDTASEDALRQFLSIFKGQADQLSSIVNSLTPAEPSSETQDDERLATMSEFSKDFFSHLEQLQETSQAKHKEQRKAIESLKQQSNDSLTETVQLLEDREREIIARKEEMAMERAKLDLEKERTKPGSRRSTPVKKP